VKEPEKNSKLSANNLNSKEVFLNPEERKENLLNKDYNIKLKPFQKSAKLTSLKCMKCMLTAKC